MNAKVGFKEVQAYAQANNVDFKTAAKKMGLSAQEAEALEKFGGDPGAPVDGFQRKPSRSFTLKSGRKVNVYKNAQGKNTYEYVAADGTKLKEEYFLKKEGMTGRHFAIDSKGRLVTVKNEAKAPKEEAGFFEKVANKVVKDVRGYVNNFTQAWKKSSGFVETTGALIGATTKTATDIVKDTAHNIEKGTAEVTGSETAGKIASYAMGVGVVADAAEAIEKFGDWSSDKIRDVAKNYTGTERQLLDGFADFVDDMNAADIALMFAGGVGAAKYLKQLPQILKLLTAGGVATASMTSCSPDDGIGGKTEINQNVNITITQNSSLEDALDALLEGQQVQTAILQKILEREIENGMTAKEILNICGGNAQLLSKILEAMTENNNLLKEVKNSINSGTNNIMNALVDIKGSVDNITNLIKDFPQYSTQLNEIINGIKTGNKSMSDMKALIEKLLNQAVKNGDTQVNILNKLSEIEKSNKSDGEKLAAMLKLLGDIKTILQGVADDLKAHFKNDAKVNKYLETIIKNQEGQKEEQTKTNEVLQQIYTLVEKLGTKGDALGKEILNYIAAVGFEMNRNFTAVLEAINKGVAGADSLRDLLEKVLEKQDKNTKAIIEAIGNIKVGPGGAVDLSSVEKMLAELLKQSQKNGDILSNIDAKTDVIATTTKSILDALNKEFGKNDERYKNINNLLTVIANKAGGKGDDAALLAKLDKILQKLDEIKDAIKNHKVEVDVTGKVTCECNCGQNHEGILGDLNDILS